VNALFTQQLTALNAGLQSFADNITRAGGMVLANLLNQPEIEAANQQAMEQYLTAQPMLVDVMRAGDAIPALAEHKRILHAGPPIAWPDMCGPVQGAILGAILYEQWAATLEQAEALIQQGEVSFEPCHHYDAVAPMAGIVSRSMPLWVIENAENHQRVFCNFNEGLGKVLRFGANGAEVIERLLWMGTELADAMKAMLAESGPIELKPIVAFGGNALIDDDAHCSINDQYQTVSNSAKYLVDLIEQGWSLVLTHGNGPQVGFILRRSELAAHEVDPVPVDYAVGDTQGAEQCAAELGWTIMEDSGRGWRRCVAGP